MSIANRKCVFQFISTDDGRRSPESAFTVAEFKEKLKGMPLDFLEGHLILILAEVEEGPEGASVKFSMAPLYKAVDFVNFDLE